MMQNFSYLIRQWHWWKPSLLIGGLMLWGTPALPQLLASGKTPSVSMPSAPEQTSRSLESVLIDLESTYQVSIVFDHAIVEDKQVEDNLPVTDDLEGSLIQLLRPFGLESRRIEEGVYVIKASKRRKKLDKLQTSPASTSLTLPGSRRSLPNRPPVITQAVVEKTITGQVTDLATGETLPGVNIVVKGTAIGTVTDVNGNYRLTAPDDAETLVFSSVGYTSEELAIGNQTVINLEMAPDIQSLSEVVVVGYGAVKKSDLTGSVSSISQEEITALPVNDVQQIMQGRAPGVQVIQNSHSPGGGLSVRIRGANSVLGGSDPLYVVDGFIGGVGLNSINPNDIESIEILKDASATAIYGSRGANGVVIITTKRGSKGSDAINFDAFYGVQEVANTIDVMNARQFAEIANARVLNDGGTEVPFPDLNNFPVDTDWQDEIFRTAPIQSYALSVNGGNESTQYLVSANYFDQTGIVENTDFVRGTVRANIDKQLGRFKLSNSFQAAQVTENDIPEGQDKGPVASALAAYPTRPVRENGAFAQMDILEYNGFNDPINNPVAEITQRKREVKTTRLFNVMYGEYKLLEGLTAKVSLGVNYSNSRRDNYTRRTIPGTNVNGVAFIGSSETVDILNENTLNYSKSFGDHSINAVVGFTSQRNEFRFFNAGSRDFVTDVLETGDLASGATIDVPNSGGTIWSQQSVLGRINYVLQDKYLFTFTGRYDGSSRVAEKNRWTFFPSFALGWRVSEEPFLANLDAISNLKLRASWGQTGNDRIPSYLSQQRISSNTFSSGEQIVVGLAPLNLPSSELDWEVTAQTNIGVDLGFADERIRLTADYYVKNTSNLLAQIQLPLSVGFGNVIQNIGELRNTGVELGLGGDILVGEFQWSVEGNFSSNRNEIVSLKDGNDVFAPPLPGGASAGSFHIVREGEPLASYYGFVEGELDETGDITYRDLDGDGEVNNNDRTILGDFFPDFIYGLNSNFSYRGIDVNIFFQGVQGVEVIRLDRFRSANSLTRGYNQLVEVTDFWTPENTDARYPRPRSGIRFRGADTYVDDASYLRLRNVQVGYTFPLTTMGVSWLRKLKIYASAQNLLTLTDYTGYDPEINTQGGGSDLRLGLDLSGYPSARTYTFGINLGF
ncbi:MAG: TonB-dependent receptor [Tunicatimonas sp.]